MFFLFFFPFYNFICKYCFDDEGQRVDYFCHIRKINYNQKRQEQKVVS